MSEVKPVAAVETLARYEPDIRYIGTGEYVAECVHADGGDYYLAADVDAAVEALRVDVMGLTARAERAEAELAACRRVVASHVEDLERCVPVLKEYGLPAIAAEVTNAVSELRAAIDQQLAQGEG